MWPTSGPWTPDSGSMWGTTCPYQTDFQERLAFWLLRMHRSSRAYVSVSILRLCNWGFSYLDYTTVLDSETWALRSRKGKRIFILKFYIHFPDSVWLQNASKFLTSPFSLPNLSFPFSFAGLSPLWSVIFSLWSFLLFLSFWLLSPYSLSIFYILNIKFKVLEFNFYVTWKNTQIPLTRTLIVNLASHARIYYILFDQGLVLSS